MEGLYYDRSRAARDGPLGEDGPVEGAGVEDRGLFERQHGHGSYDGASAGVGPGYGGRPPMPYDGGYGGFEQRRPSGEDTVYGSGGAAPSDLGYGPSDGLGDRGHHHHSKKDDDEFEQERKHKHFAEAAAAAAVGYGLYERHQKNNAEEKLEGVHGYDSDGNKKPDSQKYDY